MPGMSAINPAQASVQFGGKNSIDYAVDHKGLNDDTAMLLKDVVQTKQAKGEMNESPSYEQVLKVLNRDVFGKDQTDAN